jgi:hypothetical protein
MSSSAPCFVPGSEREQRLEALFDEIAELTGQRNAIDGRLVDIIAEIDEDNLWGGTGCRSVPALVAWKTGVSLRNAHTLTAVALRREQFPRCTDGLRQGRLSLDQVGVIAARAADGSDDHYADLAAVATVAQLSTAVKLEPRPDPDPAPQPPRSITKTSTDAHTTWKIRLPTVEADTFQAGLDAHRDALIADWTREHPDHADHADTEPPQRAPFPTTIDAFLSLIEAGWDAEASRRPHGQRTTVVVHLDLTERTAALHLGPLLSDGDRQYLTCDATCETWFERNGTVIGSGRSTRTVNRRLRRALEHRDHCCVIPGCTATRGLHAHHIRHWEHGGPTDLNNLVLLCPHHHRMHHRGELTITGTATHLVITNDDGRPLTHQSLAHTPTQPPPTVDPCPGPLGERADWWWYDPYQPQPPPSTN